MIPKEYVLFIEFLHEEDLGMMASFISLYKSWNFYMLEKMEYLHNREGSIRWYHIFCKDMENLKFLNKEKDIINVLFRNYLIDRKESLSRALTFYLNYKKALNTII